MNDRRAKERIDLGGYPLRDPAVYDGGCMIKKVIWNKKLQTRRYDKDLKCYCNDVKELQALAEVIDVSAINGKYKIRAFLPGGTRLTWVDKNELTERA